ncbi:MAG: UDP-N-acetylmuramate dehydrogenase [Frankiaceae bacterium]
MTVTTDAPLAPLTTLGIGGPARRLVTAGTDDDLVACLRELDDAPEERTLLLAGGSNVVLPDEGFDGTVVRIATRGVRLELAGEAGESGESGVLVHAAAGEPWDDLVARTVEEGLAGFECLSGIPGSTGATPVQNVGAYGQEVGDTLVAVDAYDRDRGERCRLTAAECGLGYRRSRFKHSERVVVLGVTFRLRRSAAACPVRYLELANRLGVEVGEPAGLAEVRAAVLDLRRGKAMVVDPADPDSRSAGSFFTNPVLDRAGYDALAALAGSPVPHFASAGEAGTEAIKVPAAWLIERAGFGRGYGSGAVGISTKHSLALVNRGGGTARELLALARTIRDGVRDRFGVELRPEPVIVGATL